MVVLEWSLMLILGFSLGFLCYIVNYSLDFMVFGIVVFFGFWYEKGVDMGRGIWDMG